jgi:hypothetical protein
MCKMVDATPLTAQGNTMSKYTGIIERLTKADGPNRELDCWIGYSADFRSEDIEMPWREKVDRFGFEHALSAATRDQNVWSRVLPCWSSSFDASIALCERLLPRWEWVVFQNHGACVFTFDGTDYFEFATDEGEPQIALLIATFRALEAQETETA